MGCCVSKKEVVGSSTVSSIPPTASHCSSSIDAHKLEAQIQVQKKKVQQQVEEIKEVHEVKRPEAVGGGEARVRKEVFLIKHRKSHEKERPKEIEDEVCNVGKVRTSSCSKDEVDAILIQCGRLSRNNSSGKANSSGGRKYSGSKRSYDFDVEEVKGSDEGDGEEKRQHRQRERRHNRPSSSSPSGRRRTPSRERDLNQQQQQQRSGSKERSSGGGGSSSRRVSRSPGRRSDTNNTNANGAMGIANRPGKMVSVPPTVSSSSLERSNNGGESAAISRISVKRNVGSEAATRRVVSPRSQSPARANAKENQQQPSLSCISSRKAEQSPHRRNPLSEIDPNSLAYPQTSINEAPGSNINKCKEIEAETVMKQKLNLKMNNDRVVGQGNNHKKGNRGTQNMKDVSPDCLVKEQQQVMEDATRQTSNITSTTTTVIPAGAAESLKPQTLTRSRSSRQSRDLDINPEALLNAESSYTRLLLEDIQNFHQKNTNIPSFSLPACVSKACSILEAVADLNSTTSSNLSCALSVNRRGLPTDQSNSNKAAGYSFLGKKASEAKDPFVESEVVVDDDLMEPSFHKYVTMRRGDTLGQEDDMEEQESSGSNSYSGTGAQQNWGMSSSSWEPSSVDSRFNGREKDHINALAFQRQGFSESDHEARRGVNGKRNRGIGRNMVVSGDGFLATPIVAATASM
ncbi:hypothetical protein HS088_TW05G00169 [Tripterygium wilfordii]|uniref:Serine/arginine repetitive matrix protein 2-like n=1 Tax=Tripterygium wilfordii TaxID=458696 RepID=A0A7J7DM98_TRIWF|nr:uncharacterized protein At1g65710-like [Tripterygium wilfordii]KAF5747448.1 hypothetical protein HS088_TW05G00169 [Tripterygium wilfordii]